MIKKKTDITIDDLKRIYDNEIMDEYESKIGILKISDWGKPPIDITLFDIAIFIILNNPTPMLDLSKDRLFSIRKKVTELKIYIYKHLKIDYKNEIFFEYYLSIMEGRLGKYAKYFLPLTDYFNDYTDEAVKDIKKKYLYPKGNYLENSLNGIKDEVEIVKDFLEDIEEQKETYINLYNKARKHNRNSKKPNFNPTQIDNSIKSILQERLEEIGLSKSKIKRTLPKAIKAIKQEILLLKY